MYHVSSQGGRWWAHDKCMYIIFVMITGDVEREEQRGGVGGGGGDRDNTG